MPADPHPRSDPHPTAVVLTCGDISRRRFSTAREGLSRPDDAPAGPVEVGPRPARTVLDPVLDGLPAGGRLVVAGDDADLAAVLVRLLRRERLDVAVGLLVPAGSDAAAVWGVPTGPAAALTLALHGEPSPAPLVRDDRGGVVAARHRVGPFTGAAYCDEHELVRGDAAELVVTPDPDADAGGESARSGVVAMLRGPRRWAGLRAGRLHGRRGRAVTLGCRPVTAIRDGVPDDRPLERRSWYRHTADWLLIRPDDDGP